MIATLETILNKVGLVQNSILITTLLFTCIKRKPLSYMVQHKAEYITRRKLINTTINITMITSLLTLVSLFVLGETVFGIILNIMLTSIAILVTAITAIKLIQLASK